ncbi:MAG: tetratricopeptide repeat protein, partial [Spirochaetota bacterium]
MIFSSGIYKAFFIFFLALSLTAWIDPFKDEVEKGNKSYKAENFDNAIEHYENSEKYIPDAEKEGMLFFNKGAVEYKKGNYQKGIDLFNKALQSNDLEVQKKAYFNMGNGYVKLDKFDEAFNSYARALKID